jgi:hypothetical protein
MNWVLQEKQARAQLRTHLAQYLRLTRATHALVGAAVNMGSRGRANLPSHASRVQVRILLRLSHDLRVVELAATRSYSLQAISLTANIFELSYAVGYIGTDAQRAQFWEQHGQTRTSYPSLRERRAAIEATLLTIDSSMPNVGERVEAQEALYSALCMAKHGNPIALRGFGVAAGATDTVRYYHGPFVAGYIKRQSRFALFESARLIATATGVFAIPLLTGAPAATKRRYQVASRRVGKLVETLAPHALEPRGPA